MSQSVAKYMNITVSVKGQFQTVAGMLQKSFLKSPTVRICWFKMTGKLHKLVKG